MDSKLMDSLMVQTLAEGFSSNPYPGGSSSSRVFLGTTDTKNQKKRKARKKMQKASKRKNRR